MKILALSGSLRAASINSAFLRAAARVSAQHTQVQVYAGLGQLPLFNPDLEASPPAAVADYLKQVELSDAILFASPEYAHGVSGTIKNALDWLVSLPAFVGKRVAVVNTSARAHHADDALRETLRTMSAQIVESASMTIPLLGARLLEDGMVETPEVASAIRAVLSALRDA